MDSIYTKKEIIEIEVREEYLAKLKSKDATTFLSDEEADEFDKELERKARLE